MDMSSVMVLHALIGSVVVGSGAAALSLSKGSCQHKMAGRLFVVSMLLMVPVVVAGAWLSPGSVSLLGFLFVFFMAYLLVSAWSTVARPEGLISLVERAAPVVALCISLTGAVMGIEVISRTEVQGAAPKEAYFFFASLAFVAMLLDFNNLRQGGVRGKHRIIRHVWRMSCALFFATSTLFTGPGSTVFPESVRGHTVLSVPQLAVFALALSWVVRLLFFMPRSIPSSMHAVLEEHRSADS